MPGSPWRSSTPAGAAASASAGPWGSPPGRRDWPRLTSPGSPWAGRLAEEVAEAAAVAAVRPRSSEAERG